MPKRHPFLALVALALALTLVAVACDSSGGDTTSSAATDTSTGETVITTTTDPPITSIPVEAIPGTNSASIPDDVAVQMRAEIGVLMLDVEESRGLPFLKIPTITILDESEFTARVNATLEEDLDPVELAGDEAMLKLLGMLDDDADLQSMLVSLYTEQVSGFYDLDEGELVVPVSVDGITPLQEVTITHELVHALTDQHFELKDEMDLRIEDGNGDDASAMLALIEGDATYQQFLFLEGMDPADAAAAALESLTIDTSVYDAVPTWMQKDLAFPYEQGFIFAAQLLSDGGLAGLDKAYQSPPISTEQILDPNKYIRGEMPAELVALTVALDGWELFDEATLGEWGVRMLLTDTLAPGVLAQAAAGWGNDTYRVFLDGDETAFAWSYLAESVPDAEDLANALIVHARTTMGAGPSAESGGGLVFDTASPYVFIDRIDNAIFFIASTDAEAGEELRVQLGL